MAALGGAGLGLVCGARADSIITFQGFETDNVSINSMPGFGDNISVTTPDYTATLGLGGIRGTPNISLEWVGQWDSYTKWDGGRGSVGQSDFNGGNVVSILFMPSASFAVRLASFDLDEWSEGGAGSIAWSITGLNSGLLADGNWTMSNDGGRSTITPRVSGQLGEALTLSQFCRWQKSTAIAGARHERRHRVATQQYKFSQKN